MQSNKSVQRTFFLLFPTYNHNTVTDFVADKLSSKFQGEKSSVMTSFSLVTSFFFYSTLSLQRLSSNPCLSAQNPCLNNGTCFYSPLSNKLTCMCTEGFSGSRCEVDLCARLNCPSNSECIKGERCECLPGYLGKNFARYGNLFVATQRLKKPVKVSPL